jgi:hypothetical protein
VLAADDSPYLSALRPAWACGPYERAFICDLFVWQFWAFALMIKFSQPNETGERHSRHRF